MKKALQDACNTVYPCGLTSKQAPERLRATAERIPEVACFLASIEVSEHGIVRERRCR